MPSNLYQSSYTGSLLDDGVNVGLNVIQLMSLIQEYGTDSSTMESIEWSYLMLDSSDYVLAGKRIDGGVYIADL